VNVSCSSAHPAANARDQCAVLAPKHFRQPGAEFREKRFVSLGFDQPGARIHGDELLKALGTDVEARQVDGVACK